MIRLFYRELSLQMENRTVRIEIFINTPWSVVDESAITIKVLSQYSNREVMNITYKYEQKEIE